MRIKTLNGTPEENDNLIQVMQNNFNILRIREHKKEGLCKSLNIDFELKNSLKNTRKKTL